jgi:uncharacterized protein (DUF2384 family)
MAPTAARRRPTAGNSAPRRVAPLRPQSDEPGWLVSERTQFLIDRIGGVNRLARTLGVANSQPSRWRTGQEKPSPAAAQRLLGLDYIFASALQIWEEPVVLDWLQSSNSHLAGARPIDVLALHGPLDVAEALQAELSGAYS